MLISIKINKHHMHHYDTSENTTSLVCDAVLQYFEKNIIVYSFYINTNIIVMEVYFDNTRSYN